MEISKYYKSGIFTLENWFLIIYQHMTDESHFLLIIQCAYHK